MDDRAQPVVEDCVVLVLAFLGIALLAALLAAEGQLIAEIPAARPLEQVPAERRHVADLRRRDFHRCLRQQRVSLLDDRILREPGDRDQRADLRAFLGVVLDVIQVLDLVDVDQARRLKEVFLHQVDDVHRQP